MAPWTSKGDSSPVDMGGVYSAVKGGSTVPLKFELFGSQERTSAAEVKSFTVNKVVCDSGAASDDVEATTTGGTTPRYDTMGGQFIQN